MIRYNYLKFIKKDLTYDINLYKLNSIDWGKFEFKNGYKTYTLDSKDVDKFYLVTNKFYFNLFNEDLLLLINRIEDPMELKIGQEILIPSLSDIENFIEDQLKIQT